MAILRSIVSVAIAVSVVAFFCSAASAGMVREETVRVVSDCGRYVLIFISSEPLAKELSYSQLTENERDEIRQIRATYSTSGMYRNDGSTSPLWSCSGSWGSRVIIAPDGKHVVIPGDWIYNQDGLVAVTFAASGNFLQSYWQHEMIPQYPLKRLLNGWREIECTGASFDPAAMTYTLRTSQDEEFVYDITNGKRIAVRSPFPTLYGAVAVAIVSVLLVAVWAWRRTNKPV